MAKIQLDVAVELSNADEVKELNETLAEHNLTYNVLTEHGPGGGWPLIEVEGNREDIEKYLIVYCGGDKSQAFDYHEHIED